MARLPRLSSGLLALVLVSALACKDASDNTNQAGTSIAPSAAGTNGCNGANLTFGAPVAVDLAAKLTAAGVGSLRQLAASRDGELLFATAVADTGEPTVVSILFDGSPMEPVVTRILDPSAVDALLLLLGIGSPGSLAGIAVLDDDNLLAVETTSNTILLVDRGGGGVVLFAGVGSETPGNNDGPAFFAHFNLDEDSRICPTGDGRIFVADTGNNTLRSINGTGASAFVTTLAGIGPGGAGLCFDPMVGEAEPCDLSIALLDTPSGLVVGCDNALLITERGGNNRVRELSFSGANPFTGELGGSISILAGDGMAMSANGDGLLASLAEPVSPVSTAGGEVYWVDAATGTLRRLVRSTGTVDCPQGTGGDCTTAGLFTPMAEFSLAVTEGGVLYLLEGGATSLQQLSL